MRTQEKKRRLAAIMFTDIVGYTALMHADEAAAAAARAKHREVFERQHAIHHGEIVQYYGDGTLSVFASAVEAARCAAAIQRALRTGEAVPLRIGLHLGDILHDRTEVYGDGVNTAARIQSLGVAGAVLLSAKLNDELRNQADLPTAPVGRFSLKNIPRPVEVFALTGPGLVVPGPHELNGAAPAENRTVAVLPFVNMSASPEDEYFSDGITEEIINALVKVRGLKVTSRTSSFHFKGRNVPIRRIARDLGVAAILEGSVRRAGDTVRITAQLIQAEQDHHSWSETWDRKLSNIFEVQDEIGLAIAEKLRERFGHFPIQEHLVEKRTDSIAAYELYLKAQFFANRWNPADARRAVELYEEALALDPAHVPSLLGAAHAYGFLATTQAMPVAEGWRKSREATDRALQLDPDSAGAHHQLGHIAFFSASDYGEAMCQARCALELEPNHVGAHQFLSFLHSMAGDTAASRPHLDEALRLDPLSQVSLFHSAYHHYMAGDTALALEQLDDCLSANDRNLPARYIACNCLLMLGRHDDVLRGLESMPQDLVIPSNRAGLTGLALALKGDLDEAAKYQDELIRLADGPGGYGAQYYLFLLRANTGEKDKAFAWVQQALDRSMPVCNFADPLASALKDDPRYAELHARIYHVPAKDTRPPQEQESVDAEAIERSALRLLRYMREHHPYLDPGISLRSLAARLGVPSNLISCRGIAPLRPHRRFVPDHSPSPPTCQQTPRPCHVPSRFHEGDPRPSIGSAHRSALVG